MAKKKRRKSRKRRTGRTPLKAIVALLVVLSVAVGSDAVSFDTITDLINPPKVEAVSNAEIQALIDRIEIAEPANAPYDRDEWDSPRKSFDGLTIRQYAMNHSVWDQSEGYLFSFEDPYTGKTLNSQNDIEYDHIIPLNYCNQHNGASWSSEKKNQYAYDLEVGVPASKSENRSKSDKGPSDYLPKTNRAEYCFTWLVLADKYGISISEADMDVIKVELVSVESVRVINEYL